MKLRDDASSIAPVMGELIAAIEHVAAHQALFEADVDIYGDFSEKLLEIRRLMRACGCCGELCEPQRLGGE